ncbi:hypothetical protein IWT140_01761 [Secundilactobacillus pentosiphilus]|uniref:Uncharacterized protein n=1 Tax=Secundilactobacillus pentosiphilus TaxID=1714682 RepID=A0A1Z5IQS8_9LACO|nr:hypothetical protein [Secundilactobacillus pentosiphilus]GAX04124.1 hypothetical protein IWT140_01761 [Secundilactobacillus pentosiphilus]
MYDFWIAAGGTMVFIDGVLILWWLYYRFRLAKGKKFKWPWGKITLVGIVLFFIAILGGSFSHEPKAEQRADSESSAKVASHKKAIAEKKKAETASTNAKKASEAKATSKAKQESRAKDASRKKAASEARAKTKAKEKAESQKKATSESKAKTRKQAAKQKKSAKKQQKKESNGAYQKSLTAYCNNTGNADSVKYDGDGGVTFKVDDSTLGDTKAEKKALATELSDHANKLAEMCDLNVVPYIIVQTKSGDPIARTSLGGGIKVYD